MISAFGSASVSLEQTIKEEARRLGFVLAGVTTPDPPPHRAAFENWLHQGRHASMGYMATDRSRECRSEPHRLLPECRSIIVLAAPYSKPAPIFHGQREPRPTEAEGRVAAYAWGKDYHDVLPDRMRALVDFIEQQAGKRIIARCFTDSAPVLERDLAQRAGLGWIGKNTCLINPRLGSYFLLAEIMLDLELRPDPPFETDHCGTCSRCVEACPTGCILDDRTIDAGRCVSYLTIENRGSIPLDLRPKMADWVFGCDVCQMACPWNRFAPAEGDVAFSPAAARQPLKDELQLDPDEFRSRLARSPVLRAKPTGYLRNLVVAAGNMAGPEVIPALRAAAAHGGSIVGEHAAWAMHQIEQRTGWDEQAPSRHQ